jgi:hypothetical protein
VCHAKTDLLSRPRERVAPRLAFRFRDVSGHAAALSDTCHAIKSLLYSLRIKNEYFT